MELRYAKSMIKAALKYGVIEDDRELRLSGRYSGRGMSGSTTHGLIGSKEVLERALKCLLACYAIRDRKRKTTEFVDLLWEDFKFDNMGKSDYVMY